ncbi:MAG TPA: glycosyltransferase family 2 protein [Sediminibacterium sp.]|nr:glycosyltransferase family 2 protein [Sediminibacterium sp.]
MGAETSYPRISVVMATYNGSAYLPQQLDSILSQTLLPVEIIVVDDCSTDETPALLEDYVQKYPLIRLIKQATNQGYIQSFAKGMELATGEFIALSDQDDRWMPEKLAILHAAIQGHELVYSDSILVDATGKPLGKKMSDIRNQLSYHSCLMYTVGAWAPGHAMLFRRELAQRSQPFPDIVTHDYWLGFVAACKGTVQYVNRPLVAYRQHTQNAIGADTRKAGAGKRKPVSREQKRHRIRQRIRLLCEKCPEENTAKQVLRQVAACYADFSLLHNWQRMCLFFRYRRLFLAYKKKSVLMQWLFCVKMFWKID